MFGALAKKIFGSSNDRRLKAYRPRVEAINALEPELAKLTDEQLKSRTQAMRDELANGKTLDDLLVPAFATVREAAKRVLGQRHFDVQMMGGMVLHEGAIAEMRTGEGKTLVATLPTYLNALAGKGVHVVTVNDYLARRDAEWMGRVYRFLGMSVGIIVHGKDDQERAEAYACDITYGTNNEFGFDYLRDNMKYEFAQMTQRGHSFAIVDEVDSILVDEARTPLIISGPTEDRSDLYFKIDKLVQQLQPVHYEVDEKQRTAHLTEAGNEAIEELLRAAGLIEDGALYETSNITLVHHVNQAVRAHTLFQRDKDYIVRNGEVVIIDEFTGRMMPGRRYSEGLHQALEAKEQVAVQPENATLASITFQNYFRLYEKLAGMTGTAATEAEEFQQIYRLEVIEIPTNLPVARIDEDDEVYRSDAEKARAIIREIEEAQKRGQPTLVGTTTIEKSEILAATLEKAGYTLLDVTQPDAMEQVYQAAREGRPSRMFSVLNARFHEQEAFIVAQAGVPGAITIATNMAGRGTDIQLGGNADMRIDHDLGALAPGEEAGEARKAQEAAIRVEVAQFKQRVLAAGGLYIIGTERHESRRIDNQLRGRGGRQGDPGRSKFFLSLQDDLMRIFGSDRMDGMLQKLGLKEDEAIVHSWINKAVEKAQGKVEARNFDMRKNILKYDDVLNDQRKVVFDQRRDFMRQENMRETIDDMRHHTIEDAVRSAIPEESYADQWKLDQLKQEVSMYLNLDLPIEEWGKEEGIGDTEIEERINKAADEAYAGRIERNTEEVMTYVERQVLLQTLDHLWREHIVTLDHLRQVIGWRGYAQRDPLNEYKAEAFELFDGLIKRLREQVTGHLMRIEVNFEQPPAEEGAGGYAEPGLAIPTTQMALAADDATVPAEARNPADPSSWGRIGRNEPCPCGSGKKYKHCHGQLA